MEASDKYVNLCRKLILNNIDTNQYAVFLFGSRAYKIHGARTDIDIGIFGNDAIPNKVISELREILENSIIPYRIDIVDFAKVDQNFKEIAFKKIIIWNKPKFININFKG